MSARRALGVLLWLYPPEFRAVFGDEMRDVFSRRCEEVRRRHGVLGVVALWSRTLPGLVRAAFLERVEVRKASPRLPRKVGHPMDQLQQDLRHGLRALVRSPAFTAVAVVTLALGIGVNTVVFSMVNAFLLRPLPLVEDPSRLVVLFTGGDRSFGVSSYMDYLDFVERNRTLEGFAAYKPRLADLTQDDRTERVQAMMVTANYFDVLGVRPRLGRFFTAADDDEPGAETVAVLGHDLWQTGFGGDAGVLGRPVRLNGLAFTVIGVAPPGFRGTDLASRPQVFVPMMMQPHLMPASGMLLDQRGWGGILTVGRLANGVSLEQARDDVAVIGQWLRETYPNLAGQREYSLAPLPQATLMPSDRAVVVQVSGLLFAVMALVLLVACVNVANLMLSRTLRRRREIAVRQALGAGRGRLVRQLLIESLALSSLGGAAGLAMAYFATGLLYRLPFPFALDFGFDVRILGFAAVATLLTGIGFGTLPALTASRLDLAAHMGAGRGGTRRRRFGLSGGLVVAQVALSLVLLIAAGLFVRTLVALGSTDLGFETERVLVATVDPSLQGYGRGQVGAFYERLIERVGAIPGVASASLTSALPAGADDITSFDVQGVEPAAGGRIINFTAIGPTYFETMGIPLVRGRGFTRADDGRGEPVLVVNEAAARLLSNIAAGDPLDARVGFDGPDGPFARIVGIAADSKTTSLRDDPQPMAYLAVMQRGQSQMTLVVRTDTMPPASLVPSLRDAVREVDPNVPAVQVGTLAEHLAAALLPERLAAGLLGFAAALALALASIGLYGLMSFAVARRTHEMGIRMALGARAAAVRYLVVRQAVFLVTVGIFLGLTASLAGGSLLAGFLYGVAPTDPTTYAGVIALLLLVALAASYLPARRATRIDPVCAFRAD
jgi:predicted permease